MLATQKVSRILFHSSKSHREPLDQQKQFALFLFYFQSICPYQIFLLVLATILTHRNLQWKNNVKNDCFVIFIWLGSHVCSFYTQDAFEFLNEKLRSEKREKREKKQKTSIKINVTTDEGK